MSTIEEQRKELRNSQRGSAPTGPRLDLKCSFEVKLNGDEPMWRWYDREVSEEKFSANPIIGVYIASAMRISAFDRNYGAKGGIYTSSIFFTNKDQIALFNPKGDKVATGDRIAIDMYFKTQPELSGVQPKSHKIIYFLLPTGLYSVSTNVSLAIDQLKQLESQFADYCIILTPKEYDPADQTISKKCKEVHLGPLAAKNRPKYASISVGPEITDQMFADMDIIGTLNMFKEWKEGRTKMKSADNEVEAAAATAGGEVYHDEPEVRQPAKPVVKKDDLPF